MTSQGVLSPGVMPRPQDMRQRIGTLDWKQTPLGPMADWPQSWLNLIRTVLHHGFPMIALLGPNLIQVYNDAYAVVLAKKHPAGLGQPTAECWPEVWNINEPIYQRVMQGEVVTRIDGHYPVRRSGVLEDAWFTLTYSPIYGDQDEVSGVLVTMIETTDRILAERECDRMLAQLRVNEANQHFMLALVDQLCGLTDPGELRQTATRLIAERLGADKVVWLVPQSDPPYARADARHPLALQFDPADLSLKSDGIARLKPGASSQPSVAGWPNALLLPIRQQGQPDAAVLISRPGQSWSETEITFLRACLDRANAQYHHAAVDEALRTSLEYQKLLLAELQHRMRNSLGIIELLAERSADVAVSVDAFRAAFLGRLAAFARIQAAVSRNPEQGLDLRNILQQELSVFEQSRVVLQGPDISLRPRAAECMALAVHELTTNAVKFGALRHADGRLHVSWAMMTSGIELTWQEHVPGGIPAPQRRGFGTEVIDRAMEYDLQARTQLVFAGHGLTCQIFLPRKHVIA